MTGDHSNTIVGWREWVSLPDLGVSWIKAKIDTGARTSAVHAFDAEEFERDGATWIAYSIHPWQRRDDDAVRCESLVLDRRVVRSSSGQAEERPVVRTEITIAGRRVGAELTLSQRDEMGFRMLVGRTTLAQGFLVDVATSYAGKRPRQSLRRKNWGH